VSFLNGGRTDVNNEMEPGSSSVVPEDLKNRFMRFTVDGLHEAFLHEIYQFELQYRQMFASLIQRTFTEEHKQKK
jgi:MoxR-like ATPase